MANQSGRFSLLSIVAIVCILVCFGTAIWPNIGISPIGTLVSGAAIFTPILSIPFVLLWYLGRKVQSANIRIAFIAAMLLALGWWCFAFWESFLVPENSDPQNGLVFFFAPLYSSVVAAVIGNGLAFLDARMASK
jgi:hypothetical protein